VAVGRTCRRRVSRWPHPYRSYAQLLSRGGGLATVAQAHQRTWTSVVEAVPDGAAALVVATAAGSSQGWWPACRTPTTSRGARRSATATAHASASTTAGSSASSSAGPRPEAPHRPQGTAPAAPTCWQPRHAAGHPADRRTRRSTSVASPQDLDEQHPGVEHRDHQAQDDPRNQPVEPTTGPQQQRDPGDQERQDGHASPARPTSPRTSRILVRLMEMATNSSPARAAEAPASARNSSSQPAVV
jgi:hypothetical protein